jgi:hypothetical protein
VHNVEGRRGGENVTNTRNKPNQRIQAKSNICARHHQGGVEQVCQRLEARDAFRTGQVIRWSRFEIPGPCGVHEDEMGNQAGNTRSRLLCGALQFFRGGVRPPGLLVNLKMGAASAHLGTKKLWFPTKLISVMPAPRKVPAGPADAIQIGCVTPDA